MDSQRKVTKNNVATLLRMDGKATPRSIAYAATIVCRLLVFCFHALTFLVEVGF